MTNEAPIPVQCDEREVMMQYCEEMRKELSWWVTGARFVPKDVFLEGIRQARTALCRMERLAEQFPD